MQNIVINCAKLINKHSKKNNDSDGYAKKLNLNLPIISFEADTFAYSNIDFFIVVPFSSIPPTTRQALIDDCKEGGLSIGLFTAELILKENFNGKVSFKEFDESKSGGGIIFGISVPTEGYKISVREVWYEE